MKDNIRKLSLLIRLGIIDPSNFYSIRLDGEITCQGKYDSGIAKKYLNYHFDSHIDSSGYLNLKRKNIRIVLT